MKNRKRIAAQIDAAKKAILELGDMRPGHLSSQKRASGRNVREYTQLSYTSRSEAGRTMSSRRTWCGSRRKSRTTGSSRTSANVSSPCP